MTTRLIMTRAVDTAGFKEEPGVRFALTEADSHYLSHVLRLGAGDRATVVNPGSGNELLVALVEGGRELTVEILKVTAASNPASPVSALLYPLTKGSTLDLVLEKGCELGVSHFILWQAERSVVRLSDARDRQKKLERWEKILRAASQQSRKVQVPAISLHMNLELALEERQTAPLKSAIPLVCSLAAQALPIREHVIPGGNYILAVGPEGDFSEGEEKLFRRHGFQDISLGPWRLRAETAAIAAIAMTAGLAGFPTPAKTA